VVRALAIFQKIWGNDSHVAGSLNTLAEIAYDQKAYQRAQELLQQALQIQEAFLGAEHPETARSLYNLAVLYTAQDDYHQAEDYLARSLAIRQQAFYPQHPDLIATRHRYEDLQKKQANRGQLLVVEENPRTISTLADTASSEQTQLIKRT
jgi:tetratricopeptide (TPR) repeat protein